MRQLTWTDLPGPRFFFDHIAELLTEGRQAIVALPMWPQIDAVGPLYDRIGQRSYCEVFRAAEGEYSDPIPSIATRLGLRGLNASDVYRLAEYPDIGGRILVADCDSPSRIDLWTRFADAWARVSAAMKPYERAALCVIARGGVCDWKPSLPIYQEICSWNDAFDELDALTYASCVVRASAIRDAVEQKVVTAVVASVAGSDIEVIERLAREPVDEVFRPFRILKEIASARNWTPSRIRGAALSSPYECHQRAAGYSQMHAAALAALGKHDEILMLVWRGQMAVLYPLIEECRRGWLRLLEDVVTVPHSTAFGVISRRDDLEVGHIADQLSSAPAPFGTVYRSAAFRVRDLRNRLAHFEAVPATVLRSADLGRWLHELRE